jgi:hypothetical protein
MAGVFVAALLTGLCLIPCPTQAGVPKALVLEHFDFPS